MGSTIQIKSRFDPRWGLNPWSLSYEAHALIILARVRKYNPHFQAKQQKGIFIAPLNHQTACKTNSIKSKEFAADVVTDATQLMRRWQQSESGGDK